MNTKTHQTKTGHACNCRLGRERDNCPQCEGTGQRIDFAKIRGEAVPRTAHDCLPGDSLPPIQAPASGRYRTPDGNAMIEWELEPKENGLEFSATGEFNRGAGQCLEEIARAYPQDAKVARIVAVWRKYHLNGMSAGTAEQDAFLTAHESERGALDYYSWACAALKTAGLYEVSGAGLIATGGLPAEVASGARGYRYGERWLFHAIPADVIAEIRSWADFARSDSKSLGDCQAEEFLKRNEIKLRITLSDSKPAAWEPAGHHYRITLSGHNGQGYSRRLTFDFWGSVQDASEGKDPSPRSVLSCIGSDLGTPETFEDFCSEYGEDSDSRKALQTFRRCARHAERIRAFFPEHEREELEKMR